MRLGVLQLGVVELLVQLYHKGDTQLISQTHGFSIFKIFQLMNTYSFDHFLICILFQDGSTFHKIGHGTRICTGDVAPL